MIILTFKEIKNKHNIENKAMSNIEIEDIGKDISPIPNESEMRDQPPKTIKDAGYNSIIKLHPTDGTQWVLVIKR